ncbi:MAG: glycosyltransferase family A protein [Planctomycetota bacterium]|nr:glycosyltransferase family A protein [Planctomycetota bacterium]
MHTAAQIQPTAITTPHISVVIPTHNRERLLPRTIDSLLAQRFTEYEIIVVDDGSTDGTRKVVEQYLRTEPRISYHYQQNQGACAARNQGAALARGDYLAFLDSDDEVDSQWLEHFADAIAAHNAAIVSCGCRYVENGVVWKTEIPTANGFFTSGTFAVAQDLFHLSQGYRVGLPANQQSEFRLRLLPLLRTQQRVLHAIAQPLVTSHRHDQPNIRENLPAVYQSALFILNEHRDQLLKNRRTFASWSTSTGGYAARLGKFSESRQLFLQAARCSPRDVKNYARILLTLIPGLRTAVWHRHFKNNTT